MTVTRFAIVGSGWRSEFYLRVAAALPERFACHRPAEPRTPRSGRPSRAPFAVATPETLDDLLAADPAFVVVSTPWPVTPGLLHELAGPRRAGPGRDTAGTGRSRGLRALAPLATTGRIQVAEQYQYQPLHAARLEVVRSGRLGAVSQARVSAAHGYHGVDLIRRFLGLDREPLTITAHRFVLADRRQPGSGRSADRRADRRIRPGRRFPRRQRSAASTIRDQLLLLGPRQPGVIRGERGELHGGPCGPCSITARRRSANRSPRAGRAATGARSTSSDVGDTGSIEAVRPDAPAETGSPSSTWLAGWGSRSSAARTSVRSPRPPWITSSGWPSRKRRADAGDR